MKTLPDKSLVEIGDNIRRLHAEAHDFATRAVDRAIEMGKLLCGVKDKLPHGEFGAWVQSHCGFTDRTARRYIQLYWHRDELPPAAGIRAGLAALKTDIVSDLPKWLPKNDAVVTVDDVGNAWIAWRLNGDFANALHIFADGYHGSVHGLKRGVRSDWLEHTLVFLNLPNPAARDWLTIPKSEADAFHEILMSEAA